MEARDDLVEEKERRIKSLEITVNSQAEEMARRLVGVEEALARERVQVEEERQALRKQLQEQSEAKIKELEAKVKKSEDEKSQLMKESLKYCEKYEDAAKTLQLKKGQLKKSDKDLEETEKDLQETENQLKGVKSKLKETTSEVIVLQVKLAEKESSCETLARDYKEAKKEVKLYINENETLKKKLKKRKEEIVKLKKSRKEVSTKDASKFLQFATESQGGVKRKKSETETTDEAAAKKARTEDEGSGGESSMKEVALQEDYCHSDDNDNALTIDKGGEEGLGLDKAPAEGDGTEAKAAEAEGLEDCNKPKDKEHPDQPSRLPSEAPPDRSSEFFHSLSLPTLSLPPIPSPTLPSAPSSSLLAPPTLRRLATSNLTSLFSSPLSLPPPPPPLPASSPPTASSLPPPLGSAPSTSAMAPPSLISPSLAAPSPPCSPPRCEVAMAPLHCGETRSPPELRVRDISTLLSTSPTPATSTPGIDDEEAKAARREEAVTRLKYEVAREVQRGLEKFKHIKEPELFETRSWEIFSVEDFTEVCRSHAVSCREEVMERWVRRTGGLEGIQLAEKDVARLQADLDKFFAIRQVSWLAWTPRAQICLDQCTYLSLPGRGPEAGPGGVQGGGGLQAGASLRLLRHRLPPAHQGGRQAPRRRHHRLLLRPPQGEPPS